MSFDKKPSEAYLEESQKVIQSVRQEHSFNKIKVILGLLKN